MNLDGSDYTEVYEFEEEVELRYGKLKVINNEIWTTTYHGLFKLNPSSLESTFVGDFSIAMVSRGAVHRLRLRLFNIFHVSGDIPANSLRDLAVCLLSQNGDEAVSDISRYRCCRGWLDHDFVQMDAYEPKGLGRANA